MKSIKFFFFIVLVFPYVSFGVCNDEKGDNEYEVYQVALKWKEAILKKNIIVIASFALPEDRETTINELRNKKSFLHGLFFDSEMMKKRGGKSVHSILNASDHLKTVIVNHDIPEGHGNGVSVYYYDQDVVKLEFPIDPSKEQSLLDKGSIWKTFFFKVDDCWYTSYVYGDE